MNEPLSALLGRRAKPGQLTWIGLRLQRTEPMQVVSEAQLIEDRGLDSDYSSLRAGSKRQVSLIQAEHLPVIAALSGNPQVLPELLRRNLVIEGINVLSLRAREFRIGVCVLRGTGTCEPCSKMELALGAGGYNAMRGHGGIVAKVLQGGPIRLGDVVDLTA